MPSARAATSRKKRKRSASSSSASRAESEEERKQRRRIRNRLSAQQHRERQKAYIAGLEQSVEKLTSENKRLLARVEKLTKASAEITAAIAENVAAASVASYRNGIDQHDQPHPYASLRKTEASPPPAKRSKKRGGRAKTSASSAAAAARRGRAKQQAQATAAAAAFEACREASLSQRQGQFADWGGYVVEVMSPSEQSESSDDAAMIPDLRDLDSGGQAAEDDLLSLLGWDVSDFARPTTQRYRSWDVRLPSDSQARSWEHPRI